MGKHKSREEVREEFVTWLVSQGTRYHLTLTYTPNTSVLGAIGITQNVIKNLNRSIFKGRYAAGRNFIQGVAFKEETKCHNTFHFHLLLFDESGWLPEYERMNDLLEKQVRYSRHNQKSHVKSCLLQNYINAEGANSLEWYVTKDVCWSPASNSFAGSIGLLSGRGIHFGSNDHS